MELDMASDMEIDLRTKVRTSTNMSASTNVEPVTPLKARRMASIDLACRLVVAPALLIAPFVAIDRAAAACDKVNTTVTCTGKTTNPNGDGYGTANDTGNTINV